jgi:hypothetical protein
MEVMVADKEDGGIEFVRFCHNAGVLSDDDDTGREALWESITEWLQHCEDYGVDPQTGEGGE